MSSSGDSGGGYFPGMFSAASPMPDLPVAGKNSTIGDPYQYGKFQNFLPEIKAEGRNDNATGLRPDMFTYRGPGGTTEGSTPSTTQGGDVSSQIQGLRDQLAQLQSQGGGGYGAGGYVPMQGGGSMPVYGGVGYGSTQRPTTWWGGVPQVDGAPVDTWTNRS